jgi:hypothetical protein
MSERTEEVKLAVLIGLTIALVFKSVDYFSKFFTKMLVDMWSQAPEFAMELVAFIMVFLIFLVILLIFLARSR